MDEDDCLFQLIYCIVGALLFLLGTGWVKFSLITKIRRYFSSTQRQINDLQVEIQQHRAEIAKIPIMDQFAANRKKQRIIDKLTDNLKELIQKRDKQEMTSNLIWTLFGRGLCLSLGIYLAGKSADLSVLTISSAYFYPFNFLLTYPSSSTKPDETNISLFSFIILTFFASKIFYRRVLMGKFSSKAAAPIHPELD